MDDIDTTFSPWQLVLLVLLILIVLMITLLILTNLTPIVNSIINNSTLINKIKQTNKQTQKRKVLNCISFLSLSLSQYFALRHCFFSQVTSEWGSYLRSYKVEQDIFPGMACKSKTQFHVC